MFAGVHDSYWTHAGTVDHMNRILREQFVELHSRPLLQNLLDEFRNNPAYVMEPPSGRGPRTTKHRQMNKRPVILQRVMEMQDRVDDEARGGGSMVGETSGGGGEVTHGGMGVGGGMGLGTVGGAAMGPPGVGVGMGGMGDDAPYARGTVLQQQQDKHEKQEENLLVHELQPPQAIEFPDVPELGDLDIEVVKESTYFFS